MLKFIGFYRVGMEIKGVYFNLEIMKYQILETLKSKNNTYVNMYWRIVHENELNILFTSNF